MSGSNAGMPSQVRQLRDALVNEFGDLIDLDDLPADRRDRHSSAFLTRALAALSARMLSGCTSVEAAASVIDGRDDYGIDAVIASDSAPVIWLIQSKWNERGNASCDTAAANKFIRGFKKLDEHEFDKFNLRFQTMVPKIKSILVNPSCTVHLVLSLMGNDPIHPDVEEIFDDAANDFNFFGRTVEHQTLLGRNFYEQIRADIAPQPVDIMATMDSGWHYRDTPFEAYYGLVAADELSSWHQKYGDKLFAKNVRKSLGRTRVNNRIVDTLENEPDNFWYFNNGITVICDSVQKEFFKKRASGEPVRLTLKNASIVNGAQTVASISRANQTEIADAYATVRVISLEDTPRDFAVQITEATNTQNHMEKRDFIAIDDTQEKMREDFELSLQKTYTFKRGEMDPPSDLGCSVVHAAVALACAHTNPVWAMQAKHDPDQLWEKGRGGAYTILFGNSPSALQIWRSVQVMRKTGAELHSIRESLVGRAAAITDHGDLLILHLVFQSLNTEGIDDPDWDWDATVEAIPDLVNTIVWQLVHSLNEEFGSTSFVSSTFASSDRVLRLVKTVGESLLSMSAGHVDISEFKKKPRAAAKRRPNTVRLLRDSDAIPFGTKLEFVITSETERDAISEWVNSDERRSSATWCDNASKPLRWEYDGLSYSPSGLTTRIWTLAGWADAWVAVQGPRQWSVRGGETLVDLADAIWREIVSSDASD
ncbi:AIPR family protein [Rhodococcus sp. I2R]|uniref:AIPR family protein n=1 Tax=Rhodococcus sp. I2R TaxID=2855445 RepID=UPI001E2F361F|nr:AIPR family protein [Rhodococcus sp. I2R]MCC8929011.1 AIPR family protein [Rhodococcus sp. I2R]